ncbi:hypothetical protein AMS68_002684 [Peltaster fructicola]|uniref:Uncharacterized protein n=1 Tax=Peltaster fructicola TaxID=286661 RepID=A0A6H0XQY6_9PEZI|nr:hypothetical protein AMS68_002684 [Peltaster fructicola]
MSSNRTNSALNRPYKPPLASSRSVDRSPLTPRLAPNAPSIASRHTPVSTPRLKQDVKETDVSTNNVTPRSAKRMSRVESTSTTPVQNLESPSLVRASTVSPLALAGDSTQTVSSLSLGRPTMARSPLSDTGVIRAHGPFVRSHAPSELGRMEDSIDSRFFHASDIGKVENEPKRTEPKRAAAFFYADGQQEQKSTASTRTTSPARSEKRLSSNRPPAEALEASQTKFPPALSPALSAVSSSSPFFAVATSQKPRSPSPSKESIHLSYRKGASQIFGSRPSPIPSTRAEPTSRRASFQRAITNHTKSPSLSSIDSGLSQRSRRPSTTTQDTQGPPAQKDDAHEASSSPLRSPLPSIETSLESPPTDAGAMSPTKSLSELAADARRERKVLDLEISNSSLLAINASLEREIRRQKTELKRFRRLSRAGRFSTNVHYEHRGSEGLGALAADVYGLDADFAEFGPASGLSELYDDVSDSDDQSSITSGDAGDLKVDRLAMDERRLRADLDKHRELLVQSQMMNQSLRRCMCATEEMIKEGKRAVDYKVRVSDIKLGGRILTGHEEDGDGDHIEEIEIEDDFDHMSLASPSSHDGVDDHAQSFVNLWGGIGSKTNAGRPSIERSEIGDRDSGIEIDNHSLQQDLTNS